MARIRMTTTCSKPKSLTERLSALPEGFVLKHAFYGLLGLAVIMIIVDLRALTKEQSRDPFASPALSPVRMARPERDNQIRPYLPRTRPIAPDDAGGRRRDRQRAESEAAPMRFRLGAQGTAYAEGTITPGTADAFRDFLASDRARTVTEIVLHSPGGSVNDATDIARLINEKALHTRVLPDGYCASSCPLIFAAGAERIADATSWIGVHQVFALTNTYGTLADGMEQAQMVSAAAQDLLHAFDVDPRVWTRAMATPKDQLYLFTPEELLTLQLATQVVFR